MGSPVFRLESVLRYRQGIEDQEKIKMMRASREVREQEAAADQLRLEKVRHFENSTHQGLSVSALIQREVYLEQLNLRIVRQQENVEEARQQMEIQRSRVVSASTRKKTLEQLKEKNLEEIHTQLSKTEQKTLDDIGINAYCYRDDH